MPGAPLRALDKCWTNAGLTCPHLAGQPCLAAVGCWGAGGGELGALECLLRPLKLIYLKLIGMKLIGQVLLQVAAAGVDASVWGNPGCNNGIFAAISQRSGPSLTGCGAAELPCFAHPTLSKIGREEVGDWSLQALTRSRFDGRKP